MNKNDLELFKQAVTEGLSNRFDNVANSYTDELVCSEKHNLAMRVIVYGKADDQKTKSLKARRIIAILVAAALLLTSCGIIFRNEIREIFEEFYVLVTYRDGVAKGKDIDKVYDLTYLPEGYSLDFKSISGPSTMIQYTNADGLIVLEQSIKAASGLAIDSENGYSQIIDIQGKEMYYRQTKGYHNYVWSDTDYTFHLVISDNVSEEEIEMIIQGVK